MKGGINASFVVSDMKRKEYYQKKAERQKCKEKQCSKCQYRDICEDVEEGGENGER